MGAACCSAEPSPTDEVLGTHFGTPDDQMILGKDGEPPAAITQEGHLKPVEDNNTTGSPTDADGTVSTVLSSSLGQPTAAALGPSTAEATPRERESGMELEEANKDLCDGAYLVYTTLNEGTFFVVWKKEAIPDAVAFAKPKPGIRIPPFKYRGRSEVIRHLNRSKKAPLEGVLQFLRSMQPFQCLAKHLAIGDKSIRVNDMVLFAHTNENKVVVMEPSGEFIHLPDVDMVAASYAGTLGDTDLRSLAASGDVTLNTFQLRCKQNAEHVETISLLAPEI